MMLKKVNMMPVAIVWMAIVIVVFGNATPLAAQNDERRGGDRDRRHTSDPTSFLERADRDENGYLDERELGGRLKDYVQDLGFDPSKPVSIKSVVAKVKDNRDAEELEKTREERDARRKIPKFGEDVVLADVPNFKSSAEHAQLNQGRMEDLYDDDVVEMVRGFMKRYDENEDGWLTEEESRRISRMLGSNADSDGNKKLGELEIAAAIKKQRESGEGRDWGDGRRGDRSDRGRRDRGDNRRGDRGDSEREDRDRRRGENNSRSDEGTRSFSGSSSRGKRPSDSTSSTGSKRTLSGRQTEYVEGLFRKYDANHDGLLAKSERVEISSSVKFVDADDDGNISRDEAIDSMMNPGGGNSSSGSDRSSGSSERSGRERKDRDSNRSRSESASDVTYDITGFRRIPLDNRTERSDSETDLRRHGASEDFLDLDKNQNGQISMSEFRQGEKWTDELVLKFQKHDSNNDGVITLEEYED